MAWKWLHMTRFSAVMDDARRLFFFISQPSLTPFACSLISSTISSIFLSRALISLFVFFDRLILIGSALSLSFATPYNCLPLARALPGAACSQL
ncbi:hypothetical protein J3E69DRAFT_31262 [Trichoderma sp. SZMC 28015]